MTLLALWDSSWVLDNIATVTLTPVLGTLVPRFYTDNDCSLCGTVAGHSSDTDSLLLILLQLWAQSYADITQINELANPGN